MSDADKPEVLEKDAATEPDKVSDGQVLETGSNAGSHTKLKSRHMYMIAMGGKTMPWSFAVEDHP
jgi:amino acid permease